MVVTTSVMVSVRPSKSELPAGCRQRLHHCTTGLVIAWLYTGPLGHLVAGIADWVALAARYAARLR
jgi:hypothetical protein